jgi:hypothetical protein
MINYIYIAMIVIPSLLAFGLMGLLVLGIGFRNAWLLFQAKRLVRKGYGYVKIYYPTGYPKYFLYDFTKAKDGLIEPLGVGEGSYIFKRKCIYINEYNIPTIDYLLGEADPIDTRLGMISSTNTKVLENVVSAASKARAMGQLNPLLDFLKKFWWLPLLIIGGFLLMIYFMYDGQSQALQTCMEMGRTSIVNVSSLGK